jgi:hypothetical protein
MQMLSVKTSCISYKSHGDAALEAQRVLKDLRVFNFSKFSVLVSVEPQFPKQILDIGPHLMATVSIVVGMPCRL